MSSALPVLAQLQTAGPGTTAGLWAARLGAYLCLTAVVGLLLAAGWLLRDGTADGRLGPGGVAAMRGAAAAAGAWALTVGGLFVFGLANATARPVGEVLDGALVSRFLATRYGSGMALQAAVAVGVCLLAAAARDRTFARATLLGAVAGAGALAFAGHAGTADLAPLAVVSNSLHIIAATAWVGGLAVMVRLVWGSAATTDLAATAGRFSRLAGWALAVVLATGTVNTVMHVDAVGQLLDTAWGRVVLVKVALFAGIGTFGWWNRRRLLPRLGTGPSARRAFRKIAAGEVALMVLAFGAATVLASGTPANVEAAARLEAVRTGFADGQVELTLAPARAGVNELHVYFFDGTGGLRETEEVTLTLSRAGSSVEARLLDSGPGHYTAPSVSLPTAGSYRIEVVGEVDGEQVTRTTTLTVR